MAVAEPRKQVSPSQRGSALRLMQLQSQREPDSQTGDGLSGVEESQVPVIELPNVSYTKSDTEQARWMQHQAEQSKRLQQFTGSEDAGMLGGGGETPRERQPSTQQSPSRPSGTVESTTAATPEPELEAAQTAIELQRIQFIEQRGQQEAAMYQAARKLKNDFRAAIWNAIEVLLSLAGFAVFPEIASQAIGATRLGNKIVGSDAIPDQSLGKDMFTIGRILLSFMACLAILFFLAIIIFAAITLAFKVLKFMP